MSRDRVPASPAGLCPPWCEQEAGNHELTSHEGLPVHYGPEFDGRVSVQLIDGRPLEALVFVGDEDGVVCSDPDELRRVAAALVQAADWMNHHA